MPIVEGLRSPMLKPLLKSPWRKHPRIPAGLRLYVVGDIHGRADALRDVFSRIDADLATGEFRRPVQIFLGDYIDRGPASREVLDMLIEREQHHETMPLKGNHEALFLEFFTNPAVLSSWRQFGGLQTLMSYGLKPSINPGPQEQIELAQQLMQSVPPAHLKLIADMRNSFTCGDLFFVHAGVRPGIPLKQQKEDDLLWIREDFLFHERSFKKVIVHGHTPVAEPDVRVNRINLDVGAYATGKLACMVIDESAIGFI
jgi:serine/threonine protein phosphatase 1